MRSCALLLRSSQAPTLFRATLLLLAAPTRAARATRAGQKKRKGAAGTANGAEQDVSLASFLPAVASTWMAAASHKMLQPHHVAPDSRKLVWWCCPSCQHEFTKRIDLHVAAGGACPRCHTRPTAAAPSASPTPSRSASSAKKPESKDTKTAVVAHRCRPHSAQTTLAAENANRIKKSVADGSYLRRTETRNLMPMLAKSYDKEAKKIAEDEIIAVSPKLDGIRCVTAYDARSKKILFFSRAGTLFECCDAKIEPYLQCLFEDDPSLVLDGELYNDSANMHKMAELLSPSSSTGHAKGKRGGAASAANKAAISLLSQQIAQTNPFLPKSYFAAAAPATQGSGRGSAKALAHVQQAAGEDEEVVSFDQLTSAIRTTREHRTAQHEALQRKLQYHIFDLLYSKHHPTAQDSLPFRARYDYLARRLAHAHETNMEKGRRNTFLSTSRSPHVFPYDARVLRLVPSVFTTKAYVDNFLRAAMAVGFEGVMVRRDGLKPSDGLLTLPPTPLGKSKESKGPASRQSRGDIAADVHAAQNVVKDALSSGKASSVSAAVGGYGYGQRSSTLLKYKLMQDAEFVIVSAVEGKGKWKGCLGAFVCQTADKKRTFTVTPASTDAQKLSMWKNWEKEYKGKALTVQYQELTSDGIPRFPVGKCIRGAANGQDWI